MIALHAFGEGSRLSYADSVMSTPARAIVSEAEFMALPESNQHIELLDGDVIMAPGPTVRHQDVLMRIAIALRVWAESQETAVSVLQSPLDVRFGPNRILQPDAMVFLERISHETPTPISRIPAICIEVLSGDRVYDRVTKRYVYAEAGVHEYWVVDSSRNFVERRTAPSLTTLETLDHELASPLLPGFLLDLRAVFAC